MIRSVARLTIAFLFSVCLHAAAASASPLVVYLSNTGLDTNPCTVAQPCATFFHGATNVATSGQVSCLDAFNSQENDTFSPPFTMFTIDCPGGVWGTTGINGGATLTLAQSSITVKIRHLTFNGATGGLSAIEVTGSGTLILDDCVFEGFGGAAALDITPNGPLTLVIKNSRISNSAAGVLLQPAAGGSINATLDHVVITGNTGTGGGIKTNSANGIVNLDITESEISYNGGVGVNGRSGGFLSMVNIKNSVITENGAQGVQANGANVGITVQTTLLDQNAGGATSIEAGGHISTYGNNSIVGGAGSGFTATAPLQ
jgi:hypothetical protein